MQTTLHVDGRQQFQHAKAPLDFHDCHIIFAMICTSNKTNFFMSKEFVTEYTSQVFAYILDNDKAYRSSMHSFWQAFKKPTHFQNTRKLRRHVRSRVVSAHAGSC
jgi:hypothetical protein